MRGTESGFLRRMALVGALPAMALLGGCDRNPTDPGDEHGVPVRMELIDRATGERLAYTHDDHWDGGLPHLHPGEEIAVNARFLDAEDREIPLGGEYEVRAILDDDAPAGIVSFSNHGDHVDIEGVAEGKTLLVFQLFHGSHSDWDSPAIEIEVEDH